MIPTLMVKMNENPENALMIKDIKNISDEEMLLFSFPLISTFSCGFIKWRYSKLVGEF